MDFGRLYGDLFAHPKLIDLRNAEVGVWTRCLSWTIRHHHTGGLLPRAVPGMFQDGDDDIDDVIAALADHRLWVPEGQGWRVHNWPRRQPDVARFEQARRAGQQSAAVRRARYGTAQPRTTLDLPFDDPFGTNGRTLPEPVKERERVNPPKAPPFEGGAEASGDPSGRRPRQRRREPTAREEILAWAAAKQAEDPA